MNTEQNESEQFSGQARRTSVISRIGRRLIIFPLLAIAGLYFLSFTSSKPASLGAVDGQLAKCPASPNCVSTRADDLKKSMPAIPYIGGEADQTLEKIKASIEASFPRATLASQADGYLHYEFTSLLFRFVDDVEFLADDNTRLVHFRSASRVGHSDMGANRRRMSKICEGLNQ